MGAFDKLMSNPFFGAGIGILQGQTPSRTRPNFAANAMGGLQNAMANRTSIQNQSALETERERQKIEYEQKQNQILAEQEFLARINASSQPTTTSPNRLPTQLSPSGLPNTPPTGQFGGIPPIPGQGENQQGTTTRTQQYVSTLNQRLVQINDALGSGKIPSIPRYNELLVEKAKVEKDIYEATKPQDSPTSIQEYNLALGQGYKGTFQQWKAETKIPGVNINMNEGNKSVDTTQLQYYRRQTEDGGWENPKYPMTVSELRGGGYTYVSPSVVDMENSNIDEYKKALQASMVFNATIPIYEAALDRIGTVILPGPEKQELESAFTQMQMVAKMDMVKMEMATQL